MGVMDFFMQLILIAKNDGQDHQMILFSAPCINSSIIIDVHCVRMNERSNQKTRTPI